MKKFDNEDLRQVLNSNAQSIMKEIQLIRSRGKRKAPSRQYDTVKPTQLHPHSLNYEDEQLKQL